MKDILATGEYFLTDRERERLLKRLNKEAGKSWTNYSVRRRRWDFLEAFIDGRQIFDKTTGELVGWETAMSPSATNDVDDEQFIFNKARRIHLSNMQRLTAYSIDLMVLPNTKKPEDKAGARLGRLVLNTVIEEADEDRLKRDIAWYLDTRGTAFLKHWFDPNGGPMVHPLEKKLDGSIEADKTKKVTAGLVRWDVVDPACILLPEGCERLEDADWLEEFQVLSTSEIYRRTGVKVEKESIAFEEGLEGQINANADWRNADDEYKDHAVLRTRFYRECPMYAKGAIFSYTSKDLIRSTQLKKFYEGIPYSQCHGIYNPKSPFGETWLWDVLPACVAENIYMTSMVNYTKMLPKLNMQAPSSARVKLEKINNGTGNLHIYQGEKGMEPLSFPPLSDSVIQGLGVVQQQSMALGASQDISRANRAYSGNAIATLQQIDDSAFRPTLTSIESMFKKASRFTLPLVAKFYDTPRVVRLTGMKGWEVEEAFTGSMLNDNFLANVNLMTGRPTNSVIAREDIYKAAKDGFIDRNEARAHLEFDSKYVIWEDIQKSAEIAERYVNALANYPDNYAEIDEVDEATGLPTGQRVMQCKTPYHDFYDIPVMVKKLDEYMQENYDHIQEQVVKETFKKHRYFYLDILAQRAEQAAALGAGPGPQKPKGKGKPGGDQPNQLDLPLAGPDSVQNADDQPDRGAIPQPGNSQLTAV